MLSSLLEEELSLSLLKDNEEAVELIESLLSLSHSSVSWERAWEWLREGIEGLSDALKVWDWLCDAVDILNGVRRAL